MTVLCDVAERKVKRKVRRGRRIEGGEVALKVWERAWEPRRCNTMY